MAHGVRVGDERDGVSEEKKERRGERGEGVVALRRVVRRPLDLGWAAHKSGRRRSRSKWEEIERLKRERGREKE